ncbi:MAG: 50S ribosomal protein L23 [Gammaproteobacteria bacterium]|nr:50S ribosomal protein L23 [Gammaproteobacteria bacterium]MCH9764140.1 50S ribosomal protein L23 [Gammaproteobacteria bacterium]
MNPERVMMVLLEPIISEKATRVADKSKQFVFRVLKTATKAEIKQAVEHLFEVSVKSVSVLNMAGKRKRFRQTEGKRSDWKKAYVSLAPGQEIDFTVTE